MCSVNLRCPCRSPLVYSPSGEWKIVSVEQIERWALNSRTVAIKIAFFAPRNFFENFLRLYRGNEKLCAPMVRPDYSVFLDSPSDSGPYFHPCRARGWPSNLVAHRDSRRCIFAVVLLRLLHTPLVFQSKVVHFMFQDTTPAWKVFISWHSMQVLAKLIFLLLDEKTWISFATNVTWVTRKNLDFLVTLALFQYLH